MDSGSAAWQTDFSAVVERHALVVEEASAASYGVRLYVATGIQPPLPQAERGDVTPEQVVNHFLSIAVAAEQGPEAIRDIVKAPQYAEAFIEGFGDIAPDGVDVGRVVCSAPSWRIPNSPRTTLQRAHRDALRAAIQEKEREPRAGESTYEGKLVEVRLRSQERWLGLTMPGHTDPAPGRHSCEVDSNG